ncbi:MAG: cytochrome c family protein [Sedimentitalea sp.]|nr:cytochrome c family protein [Sedimentitalea sp.]
MDTMTITKAAGALIGALLIFMLAQWAGAALFSTGGHGEASFVIEVEGDAADAEVPEVSFAEMFAAADPAKGEKIFKKCAACHKLEPGENATGPSLYGVVGRAVASVAGFGYSDAMAAHGGEWTPEVLSEFLAKPSEAVPGTAMSFAGLPKTEDRVNLIAYLNDHSDAPYVMEAAAATEADAAAAAETDTTETAEAATTESTEAAPAETTEAAPAETTEAAPAATEPAASETPAADSGAAATETAPAATETAPAATETAPAATESDAAATEAAPAESADAGAALAGADIEAGSKVFKKCAACHKINGENGIGPHLDGVVGRPIASVEDFKYSDVMAGLGGDWTPERLSEFLAKPRDFAPGTAMSFAGLRKDEEIVNVIGYLNSLQN